MAGSRTPSSPTVYSGAGCIFFENRRILPRRLLRRLHPCTELLGVSIYRKLTDALEGDPPPETRRHLWYVARATLRRWLRREYASEKVERFIGKIRNGFEYWFTFVRHSEVEPTNNRAERALREHVVQRKIIGTLRNEKGTSIHERIMTVLATWAQQGFNSFQMLRLKLSG
jgi:transposase